MRRWSWEWGVRGTNRNGGMIRITNWRKDIGNTVTMVRTQKDIEQLSSIRGTVRNMSGRGNHLGEILRDWEIISIDTRSVSITSVPVLRECTLWWMLKPPNTMMCTEAWSKIALSMLSEIASSTAQEGKEEEEICCWMSKSKEETHELVRATFRRIFTS